MFQIWEADLYSGGGRREITTIGVTKPVAISVDWIGNNLYIADEGSMRIELVNIASGHQRSIVTDYLPWPLDVAVDSTEG